MVHFFAVVVAFTASAATTMASSISEYYNKECTSNINLYFSEPPRSCYTQQGASIGYTLDSVCSFYIYNGVNCAGSPVASNGAATKGCLDFPSTGGSWKSFC